MPVSHHIIGLNYKAKKYFCKAIFLTNVIMLVNSTQFGGRVNRHIKTFNTIKH